jgi:hypothetical protein
MKELCWINYALPYGLCYVRKPDGADDKGSGYSIDRDLNVYGYDDETDFCYRIPGASVMAENGKPVRFNGELSVWENTEDDVRDAFYIRDDEQAEEIISAYEHCSNCANCPLDNPEGWRCGYLYDRAKAHLSRREGS